MTPPDLSAGHCNAFPGYTEMTEAEQLTVCRKGGNCPVMDECLEFGLSDPHNRHAGLVFGGQPLRTLSRLRKQRDKARRHLKAVGT